MTIEKTSNADGMRTTFAVLAFILSAVMFFVERGQVPILSVLSIPLSILVLGTYVYLCLLSGQSVMFTSFYQVYYMVGLFLSALSISGGAYMIEIKAFGSANGVIWIILSYFIAGMEATFRGFRSGFSIDVDKIPPDKSWTFSKYIILSIVFIVAAISAFTIIRVGSPVLLGVDRVTFWQILAPSYLSFFPSLAIQTFFFACYFIILGSKRKDNPLLIFFVAIIYILITWMVLGEKFTAFILILTAWVMILPGVFPDFKIRPSYVIWGLAILLLLVVLVIWSYSQLGYDPFFILSRIALQAQLNWIVLEDPYALSIMPKGDWVCYFGCGPIEDGKDYITQYYLPKDVYEHYSRVGSGLSGFMPSLSILSFGVAISLSMHIFICYVLGVVQSSILQFIQNNRLLLSFLMYKIQLGLALIWFTAANSAIPGTLATVVVLIIGLAVSRRGFVVAAQS